MTSKELNETAGLRVRVSKFFQACVTFNHLELIKAQAQNRQSGI
jgi:hypothetical protein